MMAEPMQVDHLILDDADGIASSDNIVHGNASMDLESYISNYTGYIKYQRLLYIARQCPALRVEALSLAHDYVKTQTLDIHAYNTIFKQIQLLMGSTTATQPPGLSNGAAHLPDAVPSVSSNHVSAAVGLPANRNSVSSQQNSLSNRFTYDLSWVEVTKRNSVFNLERLDTDLKNYKANSIKESIRRGSDDLGDMYMLCGDLSSALKCYSRSRDYCTTFRQDITTYLNVIRVGIFLRNWSHVNTHVSRAENLHDLKTDATDQVAAVSSYRDLQMTARTKLHCATGLAELAAANFKGAARSFLMASYDHCDYNEVLTVSNVAHYGGLCALATFDRGELKSRLLNNVSFKQFLEAEPQIRDIIHNFYNSQYTNCLLALDKIKDFLRLDIFLSEHVHFLYQQIRSRALCQYFSPYLSADLNKMAAAFNTSVLLLEDELTTLILDGSMNARIDSHGKMLHSRSVDQRCHTFERALNLAGDYERKTKAILLRTALQKYNLCVKSSTKEENEGRYPEGLGLGPRQ